ncbi:hypothetical protein CK203_060641 [Vitis vinifera]|uniref:Uncharacterized protein n=1 Tax=Vitis vinifera TaxID=29760 RepID=A0A438GEH3_VITVI|nr:hypothetical protein CK203_060641 [Vitis vinifera]
MVETSRNWSKKRPFTLWAYRTSFCTSIGATPFLLVYGMEVDMLVEIKVGSLRIALEHHIAETDWKRVKPRKFQKSDLVLRVLRGLISDPRGRSWFFFPPFGLVARLSLSFVFIVSSCPSFVFPCVMMMRSRPSISNQAKSLGSHVSPIFDVVHSEAWYYLLGSVHWLKYRMSVNLYFLRISRNSIMLSPFNLLISGPRSETYDAESWDY